MALVGKLVVIKGPNKDENCIIPLNGEATIGRNLQCSIPIPDIKLSRIHCIVRQMGDRFEVLDSKSMNGTFVNQQPVDVSMTLTSGDIIEVGDTLIKFLYEEESKAITEEIEEVENIDDIDEKN